MIDAADFEQVEGFVDVLRRPFLAGVSDCQQPLAPGTVEYGRELRWRVALFRRVEPHGDECVLVGQGRLQGPHRIRRAQVAQKTQDQMVRDTELCLPFAQCAGDALQDRLEGNAALGVGLRVEENLNMDHALLMRLAQIRRRELVKVFGIAQHVGAGVIDVQKGL